MLNPALDVTALRKRFSGDGRVVVKNVLTDEVATALWKSTGYISTENLWYHAAHGDPRYYNPDVPDATGHFSYRFAKYPVANVSLQELIGGAQGDSRRVGFRSVMKIGSHPERELPKGHPLLEFGSFANSAQFVDLVSEITGQDLPAGRTVCTLSRYAGGDYLALHDDDIKTSGGRRVAYVLSTLR